MVDFSKETKKCQVCGDLIGSGKFCDNACRAYSRSRYINESWSDFWKRKTEARSPLILQVDMKSVFTKRNRKKVIAYGKQ